MTASGHVSPLGTPVYLWLPSLSWVRLVVRDPPQVFTLWASVGGRDVSVGDMSLRWGDRRLLILLDRRRFIYFVNNSATTI